MAYSEPRSVLICGGGTWGLSTALQLSRNGYRNITVVDGYSIPSPISAANDINKIIESADSDDMSVPGNMCLQMAMDSWVNDPVYKPYFHRTGCILASSSPEGLAGLGSREEFDKNPEYEPLETAEDFRKTMPDGILTGKFPNWTGWYKRKGCGWGHARKTLESVHAECLRLGVKFITGHNGDISHLIYDGGDVKGAEAKNGARHYADLVILCAGAGSNELFDFKGQLRPAAWTLAHIKMKPEELERFRDLPVLFNNELGFFMEPDEDRGELKICDEHPGYLNWAPEDKLNQVPGGPSNRTRRSVPYPRHSLPKACELRLRKFLSATMPHLIDRPFCFGRICWDTDTPDRVFLIDRVPEFPSLIVAVGGSGNGFMNMPAIGQIVHAIIENRLEPVLKKAYRWRPETAAHRNFWDTQQRFGADNVVMDLQTVDEWIDLPYTDN